MHKIKKAIIPAAGFGTRLLPATKAIPKEMFPVAGKPVIQHIVEEAIDAGIEEILIIISAGKEAITQHFSYNPTLENRLKADGKLEVLQEVKKLRSLANIQYLYQQELKGLGDAIKLGHKFIGEDAFMILLGDTIISTHKASQILIEKYETTGSSCVLVQRVPKSLVNRYGILDGDFDNTLKAFKVKAFKVKKWVEKPSEESAPSNLAVAGRYVFTSSIFRHLEGLSRGVNNEIQLTDAMHALLKEEATYAHVLNGTRYDIGNFQDFIKANVELTRQC